MVEAFPRTLSLLRKEKGISQRAAAESLQISQALLSHYENGAREPSYDFLIRAAQYYNVSADYLLGLTMARERSEELLPESPEGIKAAKTSPQLKTLLRSMHLLGEICQSIGKSKLSENVEKFMTLALYKLFRYIYLSFPNAKDELFSIPFSAFAELCDVEMKRAELSVKLSSQQLAESKSSEQEMSYDILKERYPRYSRYAMMLLYDAGEYLAPSEDLYESAGMK